MKLATEDRQLPTSSPTADAQNRPPSLNQAGRITSDISRYIRGYVVSAAVNQMVGPGKTQFRETNSPPSLRSPTS
jgi:hypothetical protein